MNLGEKKLSYYKSMYGQLEKLEELYKDYFCLDKIKSDIIKSKFFLTKEEKDKEYEELISLESIILSTLIGLNKEKLESANSNVNGRKLFQYKDYESTTKVLLSDNSYKDGYLVAKDMCETLNFNPDKTGVFPYMLEIITDNNKTRPYDYISKIRNALLHGEYYLENQEILHVTNHDDDGNVTFEAKVLMFSLEMFVTDFFGTLGVNSSFPLYNFLILEKFKKKEDIINFFKEATLFNFNFIKMPDSYKFKGQDALYSRLNKCFALGGIEIKNFLNEIAEMEKEGLECKVQVYKLNDIQIENLCKFLFKNYKKVYKNKEIINYLYAAIKLVLQPINEISNCLGNMLTYIAYKKSYLMGNHNDDPKYLNELEYDKYCNTAFKYAIAYLKTNIINYAIECNEFEDIDFSLLKIDNLEIDDDIEFERRKTNLINKGMDIKSAENKLIIEIMRNALAHGAERINASVEPDLKTYLVDIYPNIDNLGIEISLETINNIFSSEVFKPENIKLKEKAKTLKKI